MADVAWGEFAVATLIFIVALLIYIVSPVATTSDAKFAMHVALSFYKGLQGELTPWLPAIRAQYPLGELPYHLTTTATGIYSVYPIGTPLMAVPYVAANDALGGHLIRALEQIQALKHGDSSAMADSLMCGRKARRPAADDHNVAHRCRPIR